MTHFPDDRIIFRPERGAHEQHGRVIGRTFCARPSYDIEAADGERHTNIPGALVRADEDALNLARVAEGLR